jgi:foldase protein PrsA
MLYIIKNPGRLAALLIVLALLATSGCGNNKVVAMVDGQKITRAELDAYTNVLRLLMPGQIEGMLADKSMRAVLEEKILDDMINQILIMRAVSDFSLPVTEEELEEGYQLARRQIAGMYGQEEKLEQSLKDLKVTEQDLRKLLSIYTYEEKLFAYFLEETGDDEIRAFLADNPGYAVRPAMIEPSHILLKTEAEALAVRERILAGEDFGDLAVELSVEPAAAQSRGYLDEISVNDPIWDRTFMTAAAALAVGEISEPVETQWGWHLIILHSKTEEGELSFAEVRDAAADAVAAEKISVFLAEMRERAGVKISL